MTGGQPLFQFGGETVLDLDDGVTVTADQVVVMRVALALDELEPGGAVPEIVPFHQAHGFERVHVAVDGCQIAIRLAEGGMDLPIGEGMGMAAQDVEDRLAWGRDFPVPGPEFVRELGQGLLHQPMRVGVLGTGLVHGTDRVAGRERRIRQAGRETRKRVARVRVMVGPVGRLSG